MLQLAVDDAQETQGDKQLQQECIDQHQVAQGHAAIDHAL